jgi:hypothetical protein
MAMELAESSADITTLPNMANLYMHTNLSVHAKLSVQASVGVEAKPKTRRGELPEVSTVAVGLS